MKDKLYELNQWKKMMCERMIDRDEFVCILNINEYPCSICRYFWEGLYEL